ncbi:MAG: flagellar hook-associated protein FlgK, partial [Hyphomicrobiaceae bacterium]|nr:flagellar hook-associated protein FlgK [Hyphomicrobiaceae bacterium]
LMNEFVQSLQQLTAAPENFSVREAVVGDAQVLAQQLRQLSADVQSMRQLAEDSIAVAIDEVNEALQQLATINQTLGTQGAGPFPPADLLDERDKFIDVISKNLDVRVKEADDGTVSIFTRSGNALLEGIPVQLNFDQRGDINATTLYSDNPADRGVGTVTLTASNGFSIDLIRNGILDSGRIGGLIEMRDEILVEAQAQLDELAHALATSLSTKTVQGTAAPAGPPDGFDIDTAGLLSGNPITVNYTDGGTPQTLTIIRVEDPSVLPLSNDATPDPNDTVIGISFAGGVGAAATDINTALGALGIDLVASNPAGTTLRIVDDGLAGTTDVNGITASITSTSLQDDGSQLPLFIDGGVASTPYSGSFDGDGQKLGFASRIAINDAVVQDNELLVRYASSPQTPLGDSTRPQELLDRLSTTPFDFSPAAGIGQTSGPFSGSIVSYAQRIVSLQTGRADQAVSEMTAQEVVVTALQERFQEDTAVNIDKEMAELIELQNSFAANARIIQVVDELFDVLLAIG